MKPDINPMQGFALGIVVYGLSTLPASASPVTLACQLVTGSNDPAGFSQTDQLVYDLDAGSAELRVARTIGTANPVNWTFITRPGPFPPQEDRFTVQRTEDGTIAGGGLSWMTAHAFQLDESTGNLIWSYILPNSKEPAWLNWQCER